MRSPPCTTLTACWTMKNGPRSCRGCPRAGPGAKWQTPVPVAPSKRRDAAGSGARVKGQGPSGPPLGQAVEIPGQGDPPLGQGVRAAAGAEGEHAGVGRAAAVLVAQLPQAVAEVVNA